MGIFDTLPEEYSNIRVYDYTDKFIVPGMADMHVHASQYGFRGIGMLLDCNSEWETWFAFVIGARARMSSTVAFKISSRSFFSISSVTPEYHAESPRLPCKDEVSGVSISLMVPMTYFVMVRSSASKFSR